MSDLLKSAMWGKTNNVLVFMKASPFDPNNENNNKNLVRSCSKFQKRLFSALESNQREVMTIFKLLTLSNLRFSLGHGCLLLVLTIDCEVDGNRNINVIFEG